MKVFFDASIIIAALLSPTGGSSLLFAYIKLGKITGITSQTAVEEVLEEEIGVVQIELLNKTDTVPEIP